MAFGGMAGADITDGQISYKGWDSSTDSSHGGTIVEADSSESYLFRLDCNLTF